MLRGTASREHGDIDTLRTSSQEHKTYQQAMGVERSSVSKEQEKYAIDFRRINRE